MIIFAEPGFSILEYQLFLFYTYSYSSAVTRLLRTCHDSQVAPYPYIIAKQPGATSITDFIEWLNHQY